jgi:hypothetical protein
MKTEMTVQVTAYNEDRNSFAFVVYDEIDFSDPVQVETAHEYEMPVSLFMKLVDDTTGEPEEFLAATYVVAI